MLRGKNLITNRVEMRKLFTGHGGIEILGKVVLRRKEFLSEIKDTFPVTNDCIGPDKNKQICMPGIMHRVLVGHNLERIPIGRNQLDRWKTD